MNITTLLKYEIWGTHGSTNVPGSLLDCGIKWTCRWVQMYKSRRCNNPEDQQRHTSIILKRLQTLSWNTNSMFLCMEQCVLLQLFYLKCSKTVPKDKLPGTYGQDTKMTNLCFILKRYSILFYKYYWFLGYLIIVLQWQKFGNFKLKVCGIPWSNEFVLK